MEELVWSYGEKPEKSYKKQEPECIMSSADLNINVSEFNKMSNKREMANDKLNDRELIGQVRQNPFNASNNYLSDLEVQQNFLIPKSSNNDESYVYTPSKNANFAGINE